MAKSRDEVNRVVAKINDLNELYESWQEDDKLHKDVLARAEEAARGGDKATSQKLSDFAARLATRSGKTADKIHQIAGAPNKAHIRTVPEWYKVARGIKMRNEMNAAMGRRRKVVGGVKGREAAAIWKAMLNKRRMRNVPRVVKLLRKHGK